MQSDLAQVVGLSVLFNFFNWIHGSSSIVATMISSRSLSPWEVLGLTALAEIAAPYLFGVAVARMFAEGLIVVEQIPIEVLLAALLTGVLWSVLTWFLSLPGSPSHALIGGLLGAVWLAVGSEAV